MLNKIVLDLETQRDFSEVGGRNKLHLLRVSVAVIYSYLEDRYQIFEEQEVNKLGELLQVADQVIGFNVKQFDYAVLQPYLSFALKDIPTLDMLEEVDSVLGHRISLDSLAQATLGAGKSGTGLGAISLWRAGKIDELKDYCKRDVEVTKQVYEYGKKHEKLLYQDFFDTREISVKFEEATKRTNVIQQKSLF